jgi:hypothetical protein
VLFKFLDVLVAAEQVIPRLVGGFCWAASFNAHDAKKDDGTAVEWCAHCLGCLGGRRSATRHSMTFAPSAAGQQAQYWAKAQIPDSVHDATSTS